MSDRRPNGRANESKVKNRNRSLIKLLINIYIYILYYIPRKILHLK